MKLRFSFETDTQSDEHLEPIQMVSDQLCKYISEREYGSGLELIGIHFRILKVVEGYEGYFKTRKPKYIKSFKQTFPGRSTENYAGYFSYEAITTAETYSEACSQNKNVAIKAFGKEIIESLDNLSALPATVKSTVDLEMLKRDIRSFFEQT